MPTLRYPVQVRIKSLQGTENKVAWLNAIKVKRGRYLCLTLREENYETVSWISAPVAKFMIKNFLEKEKLLARLRPGQRKLLSIYDKNDPKNLNKPLPLQDQHSNAPEGEDT